SFIENQCTFYKIPYYFFWQLGNRSGNYDKNIAHSVPALRALIKKYSNHSGIHLSYASHRKTDGMSRKLSA
ncbi:MAG: hypothetical protein QM736_09200, partial [Vicinamibacterales bacterium]